MLTRFIFSIAFLLSLTIIAEDSYHYSSGRELVKTETSDLLEKKQEKTEQGFTAQEIMKAYMINYPHRIKKIEEKNNDWAALIDTHWYYFAKGKFLREDLLKKEEEFTAYPVYQYYLGPIQTIKYSTKDKEAIKKRIHHRDKNPPNRHPGFMNALWESYDEKSAWSNMKSIFFFGHRIEVHWRLLEKIASIEMTLLKHSKNNKQIAQYIKAIKYAASFCYRKIAGTKSLSLHSYGIALDILEKNTTKKPFYWYWTRSDNKNWLEISNQDRYSPPLKVIEVFEEHGFAWGGKWTLFDGIHFEYRPEILLLNKAKENQNGNLKWI